MIQLSEWGKTLGTRNMGEQVRTYLVRALENQTQPIEISFKDVVMVSGSFADECFGKLISSIGVEGFREAFIISNLHDETIRKCLNHAFKKRLMQETP